MSIATAIPITGRVTTAMFPLLGASVLGAGVGEAVVAAVSVEVEEVVVVVLLLGVVTGAALEVAAVSVEVEEADAPWPSMSTVQSAEQSSPHPPDVLQFWTLDPSPAERVLPKVNVPPFVITFPQMSSGKREHCPPLVHETVPVDPSGTITVAEELAAAAAVALVVVVVVVTGAVAAVPVAGAPWPVIGAVQSSEQASMHPPGVPQFCSLVPPLAETVSS